MISKQLLPQLSEFLSSQMGLHFAENRWRELERGIISAAAEFSFGDPELFVRWLLSSPMTRSTVETLSRYLTVGETYFLREQHLFQTLESGVLPQLLRKITLESRRLRIWSAGCCTGEEPYSIAVMMQRLCPDLQDRHLSILGTDINPRFLQKASRGVYSQWSFRGVPDWFRERYFRMIRQGLYEILPSIRKLVTFSYLNLAEDSYPSLLNDTNAMDLIFCRNVLMYFTAERSQQVVAKLQRCLVESGWLIVSPTEVSHVFGSDLTPVHFPDAILHRRNASQYVLDEGPVSRPAPSHATECVTDIASFHRAASVQREAPPDSDSVLECRPGADTYQPADPLSEAWNLYAKGFYAEAARKVSRENRQDPKVMILLVRSYANQGKTGEALALCEDAIAWDRINPAMHYLRAILLQEQNEDHQALESLKKALFLDGDFVIAHFTMASLYQKMKKRKEAKRCFNNVLALLKRYESDDILPESDGISAGRLREIVQAIHEVWETAETSHAEAL